MIRASTIFLFLCLVVASLFGVQTVTAKLDFAPDGPDIVLSDGGTWQCSESLQFPGSKTLLVIARDGSLASLFENGTWRWVAVQASTQTIHGTESNDPPPGKFSYATSNRNKTANVGKVLQFEGQFLQEKNNADGTKNLVLDANTSGGPTYDQSVVVKNVPVSLPALKRCVITALFNGWERYKMNCGTFRNVPLFVFFIGMTPFSFVEIN